MPQLTAAMAADMDTPAVAMDIPETMVIPVAMAAIRLAVDMEIGAAIGNPRDIVMA